MQEITLKEEYIELIRLLKWVQWVPSGGIAKMVVEDGLVEVNGEKELRKRKKLRKGDRVAYDGRTLVLV